MNHSMTHYMTHNIYSRDNSGEGKQTAAPPKQKKKGPVPWDELDNMINDCMVDIDDDDEDIDDPDLENELEGMLDEEPAPVETPVAVKPDIESPVGTPSGGSPDSTVSILEERISQYKQAVQISEGSKKKRMERQLKSIETIFKKAKKGIIIKPEDIPSPPAGIGLNKQQQSKPTQL